MCKRPPPQNPTTWCGVGFAIHTWAARSRQYARTFERVMACMTRARASAWVRTWRGHRHGPGCGIGHAMGLVHNPGQEEVLTRGPGRPSSRSEKPCTREAGDAAPGKIRHTCGTRARMHRYRWHPRPCCACAREPIAPRHARTAHSFSRVDIRSRTPRSPSPHAILGHALLNHALAPPPSCPPP